MGATNHSVTKSRPWLYYALITTALWGVWGALIEIPEKAGFPATLGYAVWALTLVPVSLVAMKLIAWKPDKDIKSVMIGLAAGFMGCGGQLILFQALRSGPAYIVFPIISLYPVVTILLSVFFLREKTSKKGWAGIIIALVAILLLAYIPPGGNASHSYTWLLLAAVVFVLWGVQAFVMKMAGDSRKPGNMQAESFVLYTMVSAVLLIPVAVYMTDFSLPINWGLKGFYTAALVQLLNAAGYLFFAYTMRYGKAIIVVPMLALAPVVTVILSLIIYAVIPHPVIMAGMVLAFLAIYLMAE